MARRSKRNPKHSAKKATRRRGGGAAFMRPMHPSAALGAVIGRGSVSRPQATKRIWGYIKSHKLQDPSNRRLIRADAKLKSVFGKSSATMFEMAKIMNKHLS